MINTAPEHIQEYVERQYKEWMYIETLSGEEYNDCDEAIDAKSAEGFFNGAWGLGSTVLQTALFIDHENLMAELEEEIRERIEENQRLAKQHRVAGKRWITLTSSEHAILLQLRLDKKVLENLEKEE